MGVINTLNLEEYDVEGIGKIELVIPNNDKGDHLIKTEELSLYLSAPGYSHNSNLNILTKDTAYVVQKALALAGIEVSYEVLNKIFDDKIKITIKNKKITLFNDGNKIDEKILNNIFTPYKKGLNGMFGLGLSIVKKTLQLLKYDISVNNVKNGVNFILNIL